MEARVTISILVGDVDASGGGRRRASLTDFRTQVAQLLTKLLESSGGGLKCATFLISH
jgi:hypothetical protein